MSTMFTRYLDVHESEHVHTDPPQPLTVHVYSDGIVTLLSDEWALSIRPDGTVRVRRINGRRLCVTFNDSPYGESLNVSPGITSS